MNVRERIQFYNNFTKSSPAIDQKNRIQGNLYKKSLLLSEKITKIRERNNFESNAPKNHLNKENDINSKEVVAANKIKRCFRGHLEKLEKMKSEGLYTNKGFIKTTYNGDNKSIHGREYYHSRNKDHPIVYKPSEIPSGVEKGSFKIVTRKDDRFVALEPIRKYDRFETDNNFKDIKDIRSINTGLAVSTKLIIDRNAGVCVSKYIKSGNTIPYGAFENAANDLKTLHQRNGYLRDIKPGNTAYDGKQINFIDIDDRISLKRKMLSLVSMFNIYGKEVIYTPKYMTEGLLHNIYKCSPTRSGRLILRKTSITYSLRVADEYAFLMTMIASTTKGNNLKSSINKAKTDTLGIKILDNITDKIYNCNDVKELKHLNEWYNKTKSEYIYPGVMNKDNGKYFTPWLEANIKSEHHKSVRSLLTDPARYADTSPKTHLADMLLFK
ncbi:hypothetical protein HB991_18905 [Yersinia mollaretii]|uniref:Uncharacterized protein n=1 Tax=Yersinia mollaretii TaxID=33060 RepID=A0AA44I1N6_YERMO|nr:hypothetical protein [Yersinia mollaretii]NIL24569.1 hypothetical protein [Yersinia mollaretii]CNJ50408.1 Uncharacterised protein [Yersinia mollaretii]CQR14552.1 Uncharacterised protein [Yersinia mollaretii]